MNNPNSDRDQIDAPSFDQVNDNAQELVELRGSGRYFGVLDPSSGESINSKQNLGPICANCHKRGHIRAKCKTVVCHKCGVVGDHYETQCPTTLVCARCGEKGHMVIDCKNKTKRQYCKTCDLFNHNDENCPNIWRSYLLVKAKDSEQNELPIIYCYNCGSDQHYGDECKEPRTSRIPNINGSAFSGNNLPSILRKNYFGKIHNNRLPPKPPTEPKGIGQDLDALFGKINRRRDYNNNYHNSNKNYHKNNPNNYHNNNPNNYYNNNGTRYKEPSRSGTLLPKFKKTDHSRGRGSNKPRIKNVPTRSGFLPR